MSARLPAAVAVAALLTTGTATGSARGGKLPSIVRSLVAGGAPGAIAEVRTPAGVTRAVAGVARLKPAEPMRFADRYRIASVTKPFVATVVLELASEGRLRLTDPVDRRLPGLVPNGKAITLRQLLDHTSGLFDYDEDTAWIKARFADPSRVWRPRELVAIATRHRPEFPPGTSWRYSNTNYVLLGLTVEAVTHAPLERALRTRIFGPLHLAATTYPLKTALTGLVVHGYVGRGSGAPVPAGTYLDVTSLLSPSAWGAGQIVSSADDVTTFFAALLGGRLLPRAQLAAMKTRTLGVGYGLGLVVADTPCGAAYGHDGDVPGYRNVVWSSADGSRVASVMVNVDTTRVAWTTLRRAALDALCSG